MPLRFWFRKDWGAKYWKKRRKKMLQPLYHPVRYILLYYHSFKKTCIKDLTCKKAMKDIQKYHIQMLGYPDIAYNFLIGGDGTVYEGRGLVTKSEVVNDKYSQYNGKSLDIAYIGDFRKGAPPVMNEAVQDFIKFGIEFKYIQESPEIIEIPEKLIHFPKANLSSVKKTMWGNFVRDPNKPKVEKNTRK